MREKQKRTVCLMIAVEVDSESRREAAVEAGRYITEALAKAEGQHKFHRVQLLGDVICYFDPFNLPEFADEG